MLPASDKSSTPPKFKPICSESGPRDAVRGRGRSPAAKPLGSLASGERPMIKPIQVELLEPRQMLSSAPWGAQVTQINLDKAIANFPSITGAGETVVIID